MLCFCLAIAAFNVQAQERPNIVFIMVDDLGLGSLGCYGAGDNDDGDPHVSTPTIDDLAATGKRYTHAYAPASVCTPTRYGVLTGQYYYREIREYGTALGSDFNYLEDAVTLAERLRDDGYSTAGIGKWHLAGNLNDLDTESDVGGFDFWYEWKDWDTIENPATGNNFQKREDTDGNGDLIFPEDQKWQMQAQNIVVSEWFDDQKVIQDADPTKPFFLYFVPYAVHADLYPGDDYVNTSGADLIGDYINEVDGAVENIMDKLEEHGFDDNTLIIFTSDNGSPDQSGGTGANYKPYKATGGPDSFEVNAGLEGKKKRIYDAGFRVPFIVNWPGKVNVGVVERPMNLVDVYATIMEMRGLSMAAPDVEAGDSHSFYKEIRDQEGQTERQPMVLMSFEGIRAIVDKNSWKYIDGDTLRSPDGESGKLYNFTNNRANSEAHEQLYNLNDEPIEDWEDNDVIDNPANSSILNELRDKLADYGTDYSRGDGGGPVGGGDWEYTGEIISITSDESGSDLGLRMVDANTVDLTSTATITTNMEWTPTRVGTTDFYHLENEGTNRKLSVEGDDAGVVLGSRNSTVSNSITRAHWEPESATGGAYYLKSPREDGLYLQNDNGTLELVTSLGAATAWSMNVSGVTTYAVTVTDGAGSGNYPENASVSISATVPTGECFDFWSDPDDVLTPTEEGQESPSFDMPANAVSLTANFTTSCGSGGDTWPSSTTIEFTLESVDDPGMGLGMSGNNITLISLATITDNVKWTAEEHDVTYDYVESVSNGRRLAKNNGPVVASRSGNLTNDRVRWVEEITISGNYRLRNDRDANEYLASVGGSLAFVSSAGAATEWIVDTSGGARKANEVAEELVEAVKLSIYPNPFNSEVHISGIEADDLVRVYDLSGSILFKGKGIDKIDLSSVKSGMYLIKVGDEVHRIIKE